MNKPLLVFDGECGFCRTWIERWRRATGEAVEYAPSQEMAERFPEVEPGRFTHAVQLREPDGTWRSGAAATFRILAYAPGGGFWWACYERVPGFAPLSEWLYARVAENRGPLSKLTHWVWGSHVVPPGERATAGVFLRGLGLIYAAAFLSLWPQLGGLVGHDGIYPVGGFLPLVRQHFGMLQGLWNYPTLCWLAPNDAMLHVLSAAGTLAGISLAAGVATMPALIVAWLSYLSLATVSQDFLWFQWDSLLLETGLLAMFLFPRRWGARGSAEPPARAGIFLLRWLLFRLMFSSAVVKLSSGDPTWRSLTALQYHYQTQPLPPWTAWYAHHLPAGFQKASALLMFVIEGLVPFLIFAPRRIRFAAAGAMAGFQTLILLTGNYGVFNALTIALCVLLLDDGLWPARWRAAPPTVTPRRTGFLKALAVGALFAVSLVPLFGTLRSGVDRLEPLTSLYRLQAPFRIVDSYGLFAVMTTRRPEIVLEGSQDGREWHEYEFRWKPGDVKRRPDFVAPHMPRLDWQMWFAALGDPRNEPWFLRLCERLLAGSKPVAGLLKTNPFPDQPPRFLRALVYDYRFTDTATRRATGAWWTRTPQGYYVPAILMRADGGLVGIPPDSLGR